MLEHLATIKLPGLHSQWCKPCCYWKRLLRNLCLLEFFKFAMSFEAIYVIQCCIYHSNIASLVLINKLYHRGRNYTSSWAKNKYVICTYWANLYINERTLNSCLSERLVRNYNCVHCLRSSSAISMVKYRRMLLVCIGCRGEAKLTNLFRSCFFRISRFLMRTHPNYSYSLR
jgi:hypothetical protein